IESGSINVTVEQTNPGRNANPKVLNLSDSDTQNALTVVEAEGGFFIIIDAADADFDRVADDGTITSGNLAAADGDEFNATISVADDKLLGDEDAEQSVSANFEVESPMTELDSDPVNVTASNATISGTTNYAPGTELTVRARSTGDTQPRFFNTKTVTVQPDGTFNASFDFSAQSSGDTFGVTVRFSGSSVATADGNIMESTSTPTATATATAEPDGTETATATAAPDTDMATDTATNESDDDTETGTSTDTPGFGVAVALIALLAAALLAGRRE
ncbi:BGTF surface domain-containing protein, partial [Halolamina sp.]|uniref:BGTF surface domain-containing protein n=1 Tax=Halolamina sp. TaxID=1940283 RepID=UPI0035643132